jgi:predicted metalloprotease
VKYNDGASLDTSQVEDTRGGSMLGGLGGKTVAGGGVGIVGVVIYLLVSLLGGGSGSGSQAIGTILSDLGQGNGADQVDNNKISSECRTGADANRYLECQVVADINSIQAYWTRELPRLGRTYEPVDTVWFTGQTTTGCGSADSGAGPFYCPADKKVYIDLTFYNDIQSEFDAADTPFVNAYVLAHEYGHHVQDLLGIEAKVRTRQGATSDSVRLELQADCFAGVWARHATEPGPNGEPALITDITAADFDSALKVAGRIGDDWIQKNLGGGQINQNAFTHGTSAQRQRWLTTGYRTGDPNACDTFGAADLG